VVGIIGRRRATAAVPEPSQARIAVVDVTGYGLGAVVAAEIGDVGLRCAVADQRRPRLPGLPPGRPPEAVPLAALAALVYE